MLFMVIAYIQWGLFVLTINHGVSCRRSEGDQIVRTALRAQDDERWSKFRTRCPQVYLFGASE
jgi:hypothetical protein